MKQKIIPILVFVIMWTLVIGLLASSACGWFAEGAQVAKEEFGPRASLAKYEWFKDAAATLEAKQATIKVLQTRQDQMVADYTGTPRIKWPRTDLEQYNLWGQEVAGVKASYNSLAAEYNAQMAKFNWAFAEKGNLPKGATNPLPREFKSYTEN